MTPELRSKRKTTSTDITLQTASFVLVDGNHCQICGTSNVEVFQVNPFIKACEECCMDFVLSRRMM